MIDSISEINVPYFWEVALNSSYNEAADIRDIIRVCPLFAILNENVQGREGKWKYNVFGNGYFILKTLCYIKCILPSKKDKGTYAAGRECLIAPF